MRTAPASGWPRSSVCPGCRARNCASVSDTSPRSKESRTGTLSSVAAWAGGASGDAGMVSVQGWITVRRGGEVASEGAGHCTCTPAVPSRLSHSARSVVAKKASNSTTSPGAMAAASVAGRRVKPTSARKATGTLSPSGPGRGGRLPTRPATNSSPRPSMCSDPAIAWTPSSAARYRSQAWGGRAWRVSGSAGPQPSSCGVPRPRACRSCSSASTPASRTASARVEGRGGRAAPSSTPASVCSMAAAGRHRAMAAPAHSSCTT